MSDGFVDLQAELGGIEHDSALAFRASLGFVQGHRFFADAPRVLHQFQFVDQLVSFVLILAAIGVGM